MKNITVNKLPYLPPIRRAKRLTFTKHYVNLTMYMSQSRLSLFTWLAYESKKDNSFQYSTVLLNKYSQSVLAANKEYNPKSPTTTNYSVKSITEDFKALVESGYILPTSEEKVFIINPMLVYRPSFIGGRYKEVMDQYNSNKHIGRERGELCRDSLEFVLFTEVFVQFYRSGKL